MASFSVEHMLCRQIAPKIQTLIKVGKRKVRNRIHDKSHKRHRVNDQYGNQRVQCVIIVSHAFSTFNTYPIPITVCMALTGVTRSIFLRRLFTYTSTTFEPMSKFIPQTLSSSSLRSKTFSGDCIKRRSRRYSVDVRLSS